MDTEREGFEPSNGFKPVTAFPVLLLRPLGHLSGVLSLAAFSAAFLAEHHGFDGREGQAERTGNGGREIRRWGGQCLAGDRRAPWPGRRLSRWTRPARRF